MDLGFWGLGFRVRGLELLVYRDLGCRVTLPSGLGSDRCVSSVFLVVEPSKITFLM